MDEDFHNKDFENFIPVINLQLSQGLTELRVRTAATTEDGFTENRIERVKVNKPEVCVARPFYRFKPISDVLSLSVEDVKMAKPLANYCWQVFDQPFRKVLVYGKLEVHNITELLDKKVYKFQVDDGTGNLTAFLQVIKRDQLKVSNQLGRLTMEKNKMKHRRATGINIRGNFLPPDSIENLTILKNIAILHDETSKSIRQQRKSFELGPVNEKALVFGWLYLDKQQDVQLGIIDLWLNDQIEVAWKQHVNRIYMNQFLKNPFTPK